MSSRLPLRPGLRPQSGQYHRTRQQPSAARPERRRPAGTRPDDALRLETADFAELRRSIGVVRRLVGGRMPLAKGVYAANDAGLAVDPLDDDAERFCVSGAFLKVANPSPPLFVAWTRLCHEAAGDLLGDPEADVFAYNDDPAVGRDELLDLLDEVEARLDRLSGRDDSVDEW